MRAYKKRIAPRLANGDKRASIGHGLPPHIKRGLALRAYRERQSVSWLLEQLIVDSFNFDVEYKPQKADDLAIEARRKKAAP